MSLCVRASAGLVGVAILLAAAPAWGQTDPYETYVKTSKDFQAVQQDKDWLLAAFPSWTYMPWPYQWTIGYTTTSGTWATSHGYNGFTINGSPDPTVLSWINSNHMRFYQDHAGGKGNLYLYPIGDAQCVFTATQLFGNGVRAKPVNASMVASIKSIMTTRINAVKSSPYAGAYALDDETSWGSFVRPAMWQVTDDWSAYQSWLQSIYGAGMAPPRTNWITYDNIRGNLPTWRVNNFDASQLMDQWSFNDSYYLNTIGDLVTYSNTLDPLRPCGLVGGQSPNAFGGYDYAKLMKKVQYLESYDLGRSNSIIRSLNPQNAMPAVITHFHSNVTQTIWQSWYYQAHGTKGFIGWVENWFVGPLPATWHDQVAPTYLELGNNIGPKMSGSTWKDDGVAILYDQPSIQMSWIMDAQAHGSTWKARNGDAKLGTSHLDQRAWENMLRDEGIQYNYVGYDDLIKNGLNANVKVLILPATFCLSDAEAKQIRSFVNGGGTVIADFMPGLFDQHGKGRTTSGALDDVFGVAQNMNMTASSVFQGTSSLWSEINQEANFYYTSFAGTNGPAGQLGTNGFMTNGNNCINVSGFDKAVRASSTNIVNHIGAGTAVLMNLSPQYYNAYREQSFAAATSHRPVFMNALHDAGVNRWVDIENATASTFGYEITYWTQGARTQVMLVLNPDDLGTNGAIGMPSTTVPITLRFHGAIHNVVDERTGLPLANGSRFNFNWKLNEAVVLSYDYLSVLQGDANLDGAVSLADLDILAANWNTSVNYDDTLGDFNRDGSVGLADLDILAANWNTPAAGQGVSEPVPEPCVVALLAAALPLLRRRRPA